MNDDVPRLVDGGSEAPVELQRLLRSAQRDGPSGEQLKQLAARLGPLVGVGALASATSSAATPASTALQAGSVLKLAAIAGVAVATGFGVVLVTSQPEPVRTLGYPTRTAQTLVETRASFEVPLEPQAAPIAPVETADPAEPAAQKPRGPSEAQLLKQAQSALKDDPARALALTRVHKQRFPSGALAQEREVIAIEAMRRLGRSSDAARRVQEFRRENPDSAHLPRIDRTTPKP